MADRQDALGWWLAEAGPVTPTPALEGEVHADVAVVGGGYTGMWAAWHAKQLEPEAEVVLLEAECCGQGPSGRNGGFVNEMWFLMPALRRRFGDAAALAVGRASRDSVEAIGRWCSDHEVDAWFRQAGYLQTSTTPLHDGVWDEAATACRELGEPEACVPLSADELRRHIQSPVMRSAAFYPGAATVNPARLALGLRRRLLDHGVRIFERSPVRRRRAAGEQVRLETPQGAVMAGSVTLAAGWALAGMSPLRHRLTLTSSHMVITEPVPDLLEEIGWTGGECVTDSRAMLHYFRTTPDGRIAFGWGGGHIVLGARPRGRAEVDPVIAAEVERHLRRFFPGLEGRRVEHAWGGPIDVSPTHLPVIASAGTRAHAAFGYTGNGVGPSQLCGRVLASLALDRRDEPTRLAIVEPPPARVPPEPFRYVGGEVIRAALLRKETAEEQGHRAGPLTRFLAGIPERIGIHVGR
jgi:glycine/D-amino acid oxidase-like deaminating enzyme